MAVSKEKNEISIARKRLSRLAGDPEESALAAELIYVTDASEGILRKGSKKHPVYYLRNKKVTDTAVLARIKALVVPPAWQRVWICTLPEGHLQATGYDAKGRKQYRYHPLWSALRNHAKYSHMYEFGKTLPAMRKQLGRALRRKELSLEKVLATIVCVMQYTNVRIGNHSYEKENGSYGLTTMKDKHVSAVPNGVQFSFMGKKGVQHRVKLDDKRLARIVQQCKDIPGEELFQYYDKDGRHHAVDSGMVNDYIRQITGHNFTAKDFRTWYGSVHALECFRQHGFCEEMKERKARETAVLEAVARRLGNTRAVCRKYYIHPTVIECYHANKLDDLFCTCATDANGLTDAEAALIRLLEQHARIVIPAG